SRVIGDDIRSATAERILVTYEDIVSRTAAIPSFQINHALIAHRIENDGGLEARVVRVLAQSIAADVSADCRVIGASNTVVCCLKVESVRAGIAADCC